jgi:type II secretory pathway component HofQ
MDEEIREKDHPMKIEMQRYIKNAFEKGRTEKEILNDVGILWGIGVVKSIIKDIQTGKQRNFASYKEPLNSERY